MANSDDKKVYMMVNKDSTTIKIGESKDPNDRRKDGDVKEHGDFSVYRERPAVASTQAEEAAHRALMDKCGLERVPDTTDYFRQAGGKSGAKMSPRQLGNVWGEVCQAVDKSNIQEKN